MNIKNHLPSRDCVLVQLPDYTEKLLRKDEVLTISTLNEIKYHPTTGTVVSISPTLKEHNLQVGDTVYFEKLHWQAAKDAAFDSYTERDKGVYFEQEVYAIHLDDTFYMVLPYRYLYMSKRISGNKHAFEDLLNDGVAVISEHKTLMLNEYVLCEPVAKKEDDSVIKIADLREDDYALNQVKVINVGESEFLKSGDMVWTLVHSDIPLEEEFNQSNPNKQFIIESDNITCKLENMRYKASPNRIVIELIPQPEDEEQILKIDSEFANCQMAKVISAGTGVECKEGETIVFPRNAGRKNKLPILPGMTVQYEVIGGSDYFTTVVEDVNYVDLMK